MGGKETLHCNVDIIFSSKIDGKKQLVRGTLIKPQESLQFLIVTIIPVYSINLNKGAGFAIKKTILPKKSFRPILNLPTPCDRKKYIVCLNKM